MSAVLLDKVVVNGETLTLGTDYTVTGNTFITYLPTFLNILPIETYTTEVNFTNGYVEEAEIIIKKVPEPSSQPPPPSG